ncbi:hypothetical protein D3H65_29270 [Paraflavitalea soli]|uniref:DUF4251 domain-containing protein n=1 Tax=Paraflavitalea soli TaxID=2315862 RepID=A0A3B7MX81_9BACT|nr:hypothetical protein [Paraflavitalea soli]AXY77829.1 hypothetical protein D3H65_29270 [Paraflavitalea soli]
MVKTLCKTILPVLLLFSTHSLLAQDVIKQQSCEGGNPYQHIVDSLKQLYTGQGYTVLREASMVMESEYEMPIVMPMNQGTGYQFIFIGDPTSRLYEVRMYDWNEKQVVYKRNQWGDIDGNIVSYTYVPQFTEYHMIKPVQINKKKKKLCGYVMLLKKSGPGDQQQGRSTR